MSVASQQNFAKIGNDFSRHLVLVVKTVLIVEKVAIVQLKETCEIATTKASASEWL